MTIEVVGVGRRGVSACEYVPDNYRAVVAFGFGFVAGTEYPEINMDDSDAPDYQHELDFFLNDFVIGADHVVQRDCHINAVGVGYRLKMEETAHKGPVLSGCAG